MSGLALARRQVAAIVRRDVIIELSYPFAQVQHLFSVLAQAAFLYYAAKLVDDPDVLARYDGGYFEFVVIGLAVANFAALGLDTFASRITGEQGAGTLEIMLAGPARFATILSGSLVVPLLWALLELVVLVGLGLGIVGVGIPWRGVLLALPILALTLLVFCAFGVAIAAFVILVKRGDPFSGPLSAATAILSGALFPVEVFPSFVQWLAYGFPPFYGIRGIREALLTDAGFTDLVDEMAVLAASAAVLLVVAMALFRWSIAEAKRIGLLHST